MCARHGEVPLDIVFVSSIQFGVIPHQLSGIVSFCVCLKQQAKDL